MNVRNFRENRGLLARDVAAELQKTYSGMDAALLCKAEQPDKYGVSLTRAAEWMVKDAFQDLACEEILPVTPSDRHKLKDSVFCRLASGRKDELMKAFLSDGWPTVNEGLNHLINQYLKSKEEN